MTRMALRTAYDCFLRIWLEVVEEEDAGACARTTRAATAPASEDVRRNGDW